MPHLSKLKLNDNHLESILLTDLTSLECLNANNNQITSLDLTKSPNLKVLYTATNLITQIDLNGLIKLENLYIPDNKISILDLSSNISLKNIWLYNNALISLNLKNMNNSKIELFDVEKNFKLTCIQVDNATEAKSGKGNYSNWKLSDFCFYSNLCDNINISNK
jgi:hypothetical protein